MTLFTKQTHRHRKLMVTKVQGEGLIRNLGLTCPLLYIKQITNKDLLYSTGNYTKYFVITSKGKKSRKKDINVCITEPLFCTLETNIVNQLYINKNLKRNQNLESLALFCQFLGQMTLDEKQLSLNPNFLILQVRY